MKTIQKQGWWLTFTEIPLYFTLYLAMELGFALQWCVVVIPTCGDKGGIYRGVGEVIEIRKSSSLVHNPGIIKTMLFWKFKIPFKSQNKMKKNKTASGCRGGTGGVPRRLSLCAAMAVNRGLTKNFCLGPRTFRICEKALFLSKFTENAYELQTELVIYRWKGNWV